MAPRRVAEVTDSDPIRQALPPIRTVLGTELALPLPPPSAHSSSSSWGSPGQSWETLEGAPQQEPSSGSELRGSLRPRDSTPPAAHSGLSWDTSSVSEVHSRVSTPSHLAGSDLEARDTASFPARITSLFRSEVGSSEALEDGSLDLVPVVLHDTDEAQPSLRPRARAATLFFPPANWEPEFPNAEDLRTRGSRPRSDIESHRCQRRIGDSPMSLDSLLLHEAGPLRRPQLRNRASTVSSHPSPRDIPSPQVAYARSLPPSPHASRACTSPSPPPPMTPTTTPPPFAFNVLRPSPSGGGLITSVPIGRQRSSAARQTGAAQSSRSGSEDPRRHVCPVCHKRFNRPSSVRTHASVHTGSRPFTCPYPGCAKTFSVASNMRRHLRTHFHGGGGISSKKGGASDGEADPEEPEPDVQYLWAAAYEGRS